MADIKKLRKELAEAQEELDAMVDMKMDEEFINEQKVEVARLQEEIAKAEAGADDDEPDSGEKKAKEKKPASKAKAEKPKPASKPKETAKVKEKEAKPTAKPKRAPKSKKEEEVVIIDGKPVDKNDPDFCDKVVNAFLKRREKAKKNAKKTRTRSVMQKVAGTVAHAVETAVKSVPAKEMDKDKVSKIERLDKCTQEFLKCFREVLGEEYDSEEAKKELGDLESLITALKKKYGQKKSR